VGVCVGVCVWCVCVCVCVCVGACVCVCVSTARDTQNLPWSRRDSSVMQNCPSQLWVFTKETASPSFLSQRPTANAFHPYAFLHLHPALFQRLVSERFFCRLLGSHVSVTFIASRLEKATKMCVIELKWQSTTLRFSIRWTFIQFKFRHFDRMLKPQSKPEW